MKRYLLDTGIAGLLHRPPARGIRARRQEVSAGNWVGIAHPVLAEPVARVEGGPNRDRSMQRLHLALPAWKLWPVTEEAAFEYGRIASELRRIGRPIGQNDMMIAAIALTLGNYTIATADGDFAAVPGLKLENWAER